MSKMLLTILTAACVIGCVDQYGRVVPPDPIGQALFNALDPTVPVYEPREYVVTSSMPPVQNEQRPVVPVSDSDAVWVNGYWGWGGSDWVGYPVVGFSDPAKTLPGMTVDTMSATAGNIGGRVIGNRHAVGHGRTALGVSRRTGTASRRMDIGRPLRESPSRVRFHWEAHCDHQTAGESAGQDHLRGY